MMKIFSGAEIGSHPHIFDQTFRQRYDIYVGERKWDGVGDRQGHIERDEFDTDDALYLFALDGEDIILGGARLLPTSGPHLFSEHYAHLAVRSAVPRSPDISELTRFYVAPHCRAPRLQYWLTGVVACGTFEYCLDNGIRQLSSVIDTFLLNHMLAIGWRVRPLGLPEEYEQGTAIGVLIDVTEEGLSTARHVRCVKGRVLATKDHPVPPICLNEARRACRQSLASQ